MKQELLIYNSLKREKEVFDPLNPPFVGLYVCGPTVYGDPHLGHARSALTFDIVYRYLTHLGYKVRYVRNITDVGHLEDELAGAGEDKVAKKAKIEQLEPMEIVQHYTIRYHQAMDKLNIKRPSIEPCASGHIIEQIGVIQNILQRGYAYEVDGSVYFDLNKYAKDYPYGKLSGKVIDDLIAGSRSLDGQEEKRSPIDFALWKKGTDEHIMKWDSPWGKGFPGWHLECTAMSGKYLGVPFDIHGGGMDLQFPHHEAEIAQSVGAFDKEPVKYWIHNNMLTINGKKMSKSLGNFINLEEFFDGSHELLERAYTPQTIRFFMLQAHYGSTLDFSNEALQAAEKGFKKLMEGVSALTELSPSSETSGFDLEDFEKRCYQALNDDFNTPILIATLFDGIKFINSVRDGKATINKPDLEGLRKVFEDFTKNILGLEQEQGGQDDLSNDLVDSLIKLRQQAKSEGAYNMADAIRDELHRLKIEVRDSKSGTTWKYEG